MDAVTQVPVPVNEPVLDYAPGSPERAALEVALVELGSTSIDLPHTIAGKRVMGTGKKIEVRQPHARRKLLGTMRNATVADAQAAVDAAKAAAPGWRGAVVRRPCGHPAQGRRAALGSVARAPQRGHHARPVARPPTRPRSTRPAS